MANFNVGFTSIGGDTWHNAGGRQVHYFGGDGRNYYKGSAIIPHTWRRNTDADIMSIGQTGNLTIVVALNQGSDTRIKKDILDIDDNEGLNKILLIEPKTYKNIDETKGTDTIIGFIAQQVKNVIPEAITIGEGTLPNGDKIEDLHYLNKAYIFTLNVCATQELHRMLIRQQAIIDSLISRIEALEA